MYEFNASQLPRPYICNTYLASDEYLLKMKAPPAPEHALSSLIVCVAGGVHRHPHRVPL